MARQDDVEDKLAALEQEVSHMQRAVISHAVVDQAIGVLIAVAGLPPLQGWEVLKEVSQHTNTKLRDVAEQIVRWPREERMPERTRRALALALTRRRRAAPSGPGGGRTGPGVGTVAC